MTLRIGAAPVSFGVYGAEGSRGPDPDALLDAVAAAGYAGTELGIQGFFGTPAETAARFARAGLACIGCYIPFHFTADEATIADEMERMRRTVEELAAAGGSAPLAILADEGSAELLVHPARPWDDRSRALDEAGWTLLGRRLEAARRLADHYGLRTTFHPHISTFVESPWEVERVLDASPIGLTLDTGHFLLAGAEPRAALARFGDRVDLVHLKDVRVEVLRAAKAAGRTDFDAWWGDVSVRLGTGDVEMTGFVGDLVRGGYDGWVVVEQDRLPIGGYPDALAAASADEAHNAAWVRAAIAAAGA
ncbi:MAG: sugar phosphate isomerase/epimerase family protein [Chloroflexota bacterium]